MEWRQVKAKWRRYLSKDSDIQFIMYKGEGEIKIIITFIASRFHWNHQAISPKTVMCLISHTATCQPTVRHVAAHRLLNINKSFVERQQICLRTSADWLSNDSKSVFERKQSFLSLNERIDLSMRLCSQIKVVLIIKPFIDNATILEEDMVESECQRLQRFLSSVCF